MKIRTSFVSNSSSSSFCIIGVYIEDGKSMEGRFGESYFSNVKFPKKALGKLENYTMEGYYGTYIGVPVYEMEDSETLHEFKEKALGYINSLVPEGKEQFKIEDIKIHMEAYYS